METKLTDSQVNEYTVKLAEKITKDYQGIYAVPMGGYPIAIKLCELLDLPIYSDLAGFEKKNILIVDDLIDSGKTLKKYEGYDKAVLLVKNKLVDQVTYYAEEMDGWITFPWEKENDIEDSILRQLEYIGEDTNREGLLETPARVRKSWGKLYGGYSVDPNSLLKVFEKESYDEMVILKDIEFYSTCEHHVLPFFGKAHVAYIPSKKVIGISKLARLLEIFARRLQIQERIGEQVTTFLMQKLDAIGAACILEAQHFCMTSRGVEKQKSKIKNRENARYQRTQHSC